MDTTILDMSALDTLTPTNHRVGDSKVETGSCANNAATAEIVRQCKAARALLGWPQKKLAYEAELSLRTIHVFEKGAGNVRFSTVNRIRNALENAGVEFIAGDKYGGIGLRLTD